jgi:hypothetical protein
MMGHSHLQPDLFAGAFDNGIAISLYFSHQALAFTFPRVDRVSLRPVLHQPNLVG